MQKLRNYVNFHRARWIILLSLGAPARTTLIAMTSFVIFVISGRRSRGPVWHPASRPPKIGRGCADGTTRDHRDWGWSTWFEIARDHAIEIRNRAQHVADSRSITWSRKDMWGTRDHVIETLDACSIFTDQCADGSRVIVWYRDRYSLYEIQFFRSFKSHPGTPSGMSWSLGTPDAYLEIISRRVRSGPKKISPF